MEYPSEQIPKRDPSPLHPSPAEPPVSIRFSVYVAASVNGFVQDRYEVVG